MNVKNLYPIFVKHQQKKYVIICSMEWKYEQASLNRNIPPHLAYWWFQKVIAA